MMISCLKAVCERKPIQAATRVPKAVDRHLYQKTTGLKRKAQNYQVSSRARYFLC